MAHPRGNVVFCVFIFLFRKQARFEPEQVRPASISTGLHSPELLFEPELA